MTEYLIAVGNIAIILAWLCGWLVSFMIAFICFAASQYKRGNLMGAGFLVLGILIMALGTFMD